MYTLKLKETLQNGLKTFLEIWVFNHFVVIENLTCNFVVLPVKFRIKSSK